MYVCVRVCVCEWPVSVYFLGGGVGGGGSSKLGRVQNNCLLGLVEKLKLRSQRLCSNKKFLYVQGSFIELH